MPLLGETLRYPKLNESELASPFADALITYSGRRFPLILRCIQNQLFVNQFVSRIDRSGNYSLLRTWANAPSQQSPEQYFKEEFESFQQGLGVADTSEVRSELNRYLNIDHPTQQPFENTEDMRESMLQTLTDYMHICKDHGIPPERQDAIWKQFLKIAVMSEYGDLYENALFEWSNRNSDPQHFQHKARFITFQESEEQHKRRVKKLSPRAKDTPGLYITDTPYNKYNAYINLLISSYIVKQLPESFDLIAQETGFVPLCPPWNAVYCTDSGTSGSFVNIIGIALLAIEGNGGASSYLLESLNDPTIVPVNGITVNRLGRDERVRDVDELLHVATEEIIQASLLPLTLFSFSPQRAFAFEEMVAGKILSHVKIGQTIPENERTHPPGLEEMENLYGERIEKAIQNKRVLEEIFMICQEQ